MIAPCIHLNGSAPSNLRSGYRTARRAVEAALEAVAAAAPNMRDYYPLGDAAWVDASAEHRARMEKLRAVSDELAALEDAVADQVRERERMRS